MKHLTDETKAKLQSILADKIKAEIADGNIIEWSDFECSFNGFGFFPSVTVSYSSEQVGNEEETGEYRPTTINLVHIDYAEYRDREEQTAVLTQQERKELEIYLLNNL